MAKNTKKAVLHKTKVDNCQGWNGGHLCQRHWILVMCNCHQSSSSGASARSGISLMEMVEECWVGSRPIMFNWQVIISMGMVPQASWIILLTTRVGPTIGVGACSSLCLSGVWGSWPVCRMSVISPNPGGMLVVESSCIHVGLDLT